MDDDYISESHNRLECDGKSTFNTSNDGAIAHPENSMKLRNAADPAAWALTAKILQRLHQTLVRPCISPPRLSGRSLGRITSLVGTALDPDLNRGPAFLVRIALDLDLNQGPASSWAGVALSESRSYPRKMGYQIHKLIQRVFSAYCPKPRAIRVCKFRCTLCHFSCSLPRWLQMHGFHTSEIRGLRVFMRANRQSSGLQKLEI
jgi:hypothetical protein